MGSKHNLVQLLLSAVHNSILALPTNHVKFYTLIHCFYITYVLTYPYFCNFKRQDITIKRIKCLLKVYKGPIHSTSILEI